MEGYPAQGQTVKASDLINNPIYFKFNHPVDRSTNGLLRLLDKTAYSLCQLNGCGIIEYAENDTKLIWHPDDPALLFAPGKFFEIQIGDPQPAVCPFPPQPCSPVLIRDIFGNTLPLTYIDFDIDKCQPTVGLQMSGNKPFTCPDCINFCVDESFIIGDTITLTVELTNPSCSSKLEVEGKVWVELPDGSLLSLVDPHATLELNSGDDFSVDLINHEFLGYETLGRYEVGVRLVNPVTGDYYSTALDSFTLKSQKCQ